MDNSPPSRRRRPTSALARAFATACVALIALAHCGPAGTPDAGADARPDSPMTTEGGATCTGAQSACGSACVDLATDLANCGACGNACATGANGTARCVAGVCLVQCAAGFANCDNNPANGCEAALGTDPASCGSCGAACVTSANATSTCADGTCGVNCAEGFSDCDGAPETGCESTTGSDRENCGMCGRACPWPARSDYACESSACTFACRRGYGDCDRSGTNGCEVALLSARNCGACGTACAAPSPLCAQMGAAFSCVSTCPAGTTECDGACVDTQSNTENCGACGTTCAGGVNAQAACVGGRCGLECRPGYADCDGDPATGCEVNLALNAQHCGTCGNRCMAGPGGEGYCAGGACRVRCSPGALDCDGNPATGCEVNSNSDQNNCGGCGRSCANRGNAASLCNVGVCEMACDPGFGNCDGNAANGCETVLRSDPANCGACARRCAAGQSCIEGACTNNGCTPGTGECDGNTATMCETNLYTSMTNCGACGSVCARPGAIAECRMGGCSFEACLPGFGNCDNNRANGCETDVTTPMNCGACGVVCAFANAEATCAMGACGLGACMPGFADCDMNPRNGCEADTRSNALNCGACGRPCVPGQSCMNGTCTGVVVPPMDSGVPPTDGGMDATVPDGAGGDAVAPDGTGGDATAEAGACPMGQTSCGMGMAAACTNTQTDRDNCGTCGNACGAGRDCVAGACACPMGGLLCGGACVDPQTSGANCGMCSNACGAGQSCAGGACVCIGGQTRCGTGATATCVNTMTDDANCGACGTACTGGQVCTMGACACPTGQTLCGGRCVNTESDTANCGACSTACPAGQLCNGGMCQVECTAPRMRCGTGAAMTCADLQDDEANCGACGTACPAGSVCLMGSCGCAPAAGTTPMLCGTGASRTCVDTNTDPMNCGACGNACGAGLECRGGMCSCTGGLLTCGTATAPVCVDGTSDSSNCGRCGTVCRTAPGADFAACIGSTCRQICSTGFANCDGNIGNGCEVDTRSDDLNCGICGNGCLIPGQSCMNSVCSCVAGQTVCGSGAAAACTNRQTDRNNCGTCGNVCPNAQTCQSGTCRCPIAGQILCGGVCVDPQTSNAHCGMCNMACTGGMAPDVRSCRTGMCLCPAGQTYCAAQNRCVNTQTDPLNCNGCGTICPGQPGGPPSGGGAQVCSGGVCGLTCTAPTVVCGSGASMTCADRQTNSQHCGMCGNACTGGKVCSAGSCQCPAGQVDCGGTCRTLGTDSSNCGVCGNACPSGTTCSGGACVCSTMGTSLCPSCPAMTTCSPTAMCRNLQTDGSNCGACGSACPASSTCQSGGCVCNTGLSMCGSGASATCRDLQTDSANCGSCGNACAAGFTCSAGSCGRYTVRSTPLAAFLNAQGMAGATCVNLGDDGTTSATLPFAFGYFGQTFAAGTAINLNNNGTVSLTNTNASYGNTCDPRGSPESYRALLPYWDDLDARASAAATLCYATAGSGSTRRFIVSWIDLAHFSFSADRMTFSAVLYETTNVIEFQYSSMVGPLATGESATVGLSYDATVAQVVGCGTSGVVGSNRLITFTPN